MRKYISLVIMLLAFRLSAVAASPAAVTDLAAMSTVEGQAVLQWTVPDPGDGTSVPAGYLVKYATSEITSSSFYDSWVSTYTQTWTALKSSGTAETRTLSGLTPGATLYFAIKSSNTASPDGGAWNSLTDNGTNPLATAVIFNAPPAMVTGLSTVEGNALVNLAWAANTEIDLKQYDVERSSFSASTGFVPIVTILKPGTTHQDITVINGNLYYYRVRAEDNAANQGTYSSVVSTMPWVNVAVPSFSGAVTAVSTTSINWAWNPAANAAGYRVINSSSGVNLSGDLAAATTFWLQNGLTANTSSTVYLQAFNGLETPVNSALRTVFSLANPPSAPAFSATTSRVNLSWSNNGNDPSTRYSVQYSTDNFIHWVDAMVLTPSTTHQDTALAESTTYRYKMWAINGDGVATVKVDYSATTGSIPPDAPNLTFAETYANDGEVRIIWKASGDDGAAGHCSSYIVAWDTNPVIESNFDMLTSSMSVAASGVDDGITEPPLVVTNLYPGTTFYFALRALDKAGNRSLVSTTLSASAQDKKPPVVTGLNAFVNDPSYISLTWYASTVFDRDKYKVYRATLPFTPSSSYQVGVSTFIATSNYYSDHGLTAKTTYYYYVTCLDKGDLGNGYFSSVLESDFSSCVSTYTPDQVPPAAVTQLSAAPGTTEGKIDLSWVAPGDDGTAGAITGGKFRIDWTTDPAKNFTTNSYQLEIATTTTPGTTNTITASGLGEGVTNYFRIWTADGAGNWSALSQGATAWSQIDVTPPAAAADLAASASWQRVALSWTAPGDDGTSGTLNGSFEIRVSSNGVIDTLAKWNAVPTGYPYRLTISTQVAAGRSESAVVTGLTNGTMYYFALRSADERNNWSALSTISPSAVPVDAAPGAFNLSLPADNSIATTLQPTLRWSAAADIDTVYGDTLTYTVSYSTDVAFPIGATTVVPGVIVTSCTPTLALSVHEDKTLYWKVTAVDSDGAQSASSPGYYKLRINSVNTPPFAFSLSSPAQGTIITTASPRLAWNLSGDADPGDTVTYDVDYAQNPAFTAATSVTAVTTTYLDVAQLAENATYWWRVWANDGTARTLCSTTCYFRVNAVPEPPLPFSLTYPTDNLILATSTVVFSWQPTIDPDPAPDPTVTYELSWSESVDFVSSTTVTGLHQPTTSIAGFRENGIYYWRVTAIGPDGMRYTSSPTRRFYIDMKKELPGPFDLQEPGYNVTISTTVTPLFSWTKSIDPDPADDVRFIIDISPNANFTGLGTIAVDRGTDRYYVPLIGLTDQTTYYWRVRASGYQGNPIPQQVDPGFTFSSTGVFVISMVNNPPDPFALSMPANRSVVTTKRPTFKWGAAVDRDVNSSVNYTMMLSSCADFSVVIESATGLGATTYTAAAVLLENRTYYWKVRATDNKNAVTDCASAFSFIVPILNVPRAPAGLSGVLADDKMSFAMHWSAVTTNSDMSAIDDLAGYNIYRGMSPQTLVLFAVVSPTTVAWTDGNTQGGNLYYRIRAFDTSGIESSAEDSPLLNSLSAGSLNLLSDDQTFSVDIPPAVAQTLLAQHNQYNVDLSIRFERDSAVESDSVLAGYRLRITKSDGAALDKISFDQPLVMRFSYASGTSVAARLVAQKASTQDPGSMNIFWNNGVEYLRLGGVTDSHEHNVTLKIVKPGEYQLRRVARPTTFRVSSLDPPKVFTPGIAPYQKITFYVDNPDGDKVVGKVFDLRSEFVADLKADGDPTSSNVILEWDGQTSDSGPAHKGVYIYQIEGSGKVVNGTIVVAR
jgi:fibronectin type 3 domain-containing protein